MKKEIAIIGISIKVAGAATLEEFWQLIQKNEPGFNSLFDVRRKDVFDRFGEFEIATGSYIDRIDLFDNDFFKIAPAEAERMDPEQRLMMECAVMALQNAGYHPAGLQGQRVGIFHTYRDSRYRYFFDESSNLSITSHMPGMVGTRVANFMDWRGPVIAFDTTCSSSSTALYYACQSLANGDCSMALVGGVELGVSSSEMSRRSPIISRKGHCLPYDNDADGTLPGEGVICVLLKTVEDAVRDGDPVHAIIRGGAINHGGALIQNISAPSPVAQSEVIRMAWQQSGVTASQIRFIETHGTGTVLGDPIEFRGLVSAFEEEVMGHKNCSVSSVKGQLGHLGSLAGLVGLIRLVLALKNKKLLPQPGFGKINTHIEEKDFLKVQRTLEQWKSDSNTPRIGGVSSFGLTGTNVHMVLEEFTGNDNTAEVSENNSPFYIKIGASSSSRAEQIKVYLKEYIKQHPQLNLSDLCYSVNKITATEPFSRIIRFGSRNELEAALQELDFSTPRPKAGSTEIFLLIPALLPWNQLNALKNKVPDLAVQFKIEADNIGAEENKITDDQHSLLLHYCTAKLMMQSGFSPAKIIGAGSAKDLSLLLTGKISLRDAMKQAAMAKEAEPLNVNGFVQFLNSLSKGENYLFAVMGHQGEMIPALKQWLEINKTGNIQVVFPENAAESCCQIISACYNLGIRVEPGKIFNQKGRFLQDIHLPVFESKRCWPKVTPVFNKPAESGASETKAKEDTVKKLSTEEIISAVKVIWCEKLKVEEVGDEEDFFDLGGSSLMGLDVLQMVEKRFAVSLQYADIFDYCTVISQAKLIQEMLEKTVITAAPAKDTAAKSPATELDDEQRNLLYDGLVHRIEGENKIPVRLKHVLLTGGTGFLGAYVIKELLKQTEASITCLVRAATDVEATARLFQSLRTYFPENELEKERITVIKGDITREDLGLNEEIKRNLTGVDAVFHLAANINHYGKADTTHSVNVDGTKHMLEWAKRSSVPIFYHYSTNAVATGSHIENKETLSFYETDLDVGQNFGRNHYPLSKFNAEQYLRKNKGDIKVIIFRIGHVSGHSETGLYQQNIESNNFYQRLKTLADIGCYCDEIAGQTFATMPVDIVSGITVSLSLCRHNELETFHLIDTDPIRLGRMVELLAAQNIILEKTDITHFLEHIEELLADSDLSAENTFLGIIRYGTEQGPKTKFIVEQRATLKYLDRMGIPYAYDKQKYADTIIRYCINKGFITQKVIQLNNKSLTKKIK